MYSLDMSEEFEIKNLRGLPTPICPNCTSDWFMAPVRIDPTTYSIVMWGTDGFCFSCQAEVTIATPKDLPESWRVSDIESEGL